MATKKTKQPVKPNKSTSNAKIQDFIAYSKKHWIVSGLIVVVIIGVIIYTFTAIYQNRQLKNAEKQLDALYADIVNELGKPTSYEKSAYCDYSSAKFSKGNLSCSTSYMLDYVGTSSTQLSNSVYTAMSNSGNIIDVTKPYRYKDLGSYTLSFKLNGNNIDCGATIDEESGKQYIVLSCYQNSIYKIYPTK